MTDDPSAINDREIQDALKNGYLQGYWRAVHDFEAKKTIEELRAHVEGPLTRWRKDRAMRFKEDRADLS